MASRHVLTQRLRSGVIFSAPGNLLAIPEGGWGDDTPINRPKKPKRKVKNFGINHFSHWVAKVTPYDEPYDNVESFMPGKDTRGIGNDYRPYSVSPYPEPEVEIASATTSEMTLCLPMLSVSLTATVDGTVAHTELVQKFHNPSDIIIESAKHVFPLYDGAVITSFECTIGDERRVRGVVKPKVQARKEFEEAVRDKVAAPALLEEHTPEIFETSLGNIPADTTVEIKITYVQELKVVMMESEATEGIALTIPMSIAPRYSKAPIEWEPVSKVAEDKLDLWIRVIDNGKVNHEGCDEESGHLLQFKGSKPIEYSNVLEKDGSTKTYYVWHHVSGPAVLRKDFVFVIQMKESHHIKSRAIACPPDDNGLAAMMVNIRPNDLFRNAIIPQSFTGEILFLLDQSGSMGLSNGSYGYGRRRAGGRKIDVMREAMQLALSGIPSTCVFNVISWGSATMGLWETSRPHTQKSIREAKDYVSQVEADMGGTDLLRALESVVKRRVQDRGSTQIIILTDGELEPEDSIQFIWKKRQLFGDRIRFFALGIGDEVSHRLVESIAECGGGYSDVVHTTQTPRWHDRLNRLLKSALEPNSWSCDIDLGSQFERKDLFDFKLREENASESGKTPYIQAPFPISSLHPFSFASISFLVDLRHGGVLPKTITISTTTGGAKKKTYELPIEASSGSDGTIYRLVAKSVLLDLQDQIKRGTTETQIAKENAENIGTMYSITSKWTSFVAISENQPTQTVEEQKMNHYKALFDEIDIDELLNNVSDDEYSSSGSSSIISYDARQRPFGMNNMGSSLTANLPPDSANSLMTGRVLESASRFPIPASMPAQYMPPPPLPPPGMRPQPKFAGTSGRAYPRMPILPKGATPRGYAHPIMQRMSHPQPTPDPNAEPSVGSAPLISGQSLAYPQSPSNEAMEAHYQPDKDLQASQESDWSYLLSDRNDLGGSRFGRPPPIPAPVSRAAPARPPTGISLPPRFMEGSRGEHREVRQCSLEDDDEPEAPHPVGAPVSQHVSDPVQVKPQGPKDIIAARSLRARSKEVPGPRPWEDQDSSDSLTQATSIDDDVRIPTRERVFGDSSPAFIGADFPLYPNDSDWREAEASARTRADTEDDSLSDSPPRMGRRGRRRKCADGMSETPMAEANSGSRRTGKGRTRQFDDYTSEAKSDDGATQLPHPHVAAENTSPSGHADGNNRVLESAESTSSTVSYVPPIVFGCARHVPRPESAATREKLSEKVHQFKESAQSGVADEPMVSPSANRGFAIPAAIIKQGEPHASDDDDTGKMTEGIEGTEVGECTPQPKDTEDVVPPHGVVYAPTYGTRSRNRTGTSRINYAEDSATAEDSSVHHHHKHHPLASIPRQSTLRKTTRNPLSFSSYQNAPFSHSSPNPPPPPSGLYLPGPAQQSVTQDDIPSVPEFPTYRAPATLIPPPPRPSGAISATYIPLGDTYSVPYSTVPISGTSPVRAMSSSRKTFDVPLGASLMNPSKKQFDLDHEDGSRSSFESTSHQHESHGPLNWLVAMECQDGQGLFELTDQARGTLRLHFCQGTDDKLGPEILKLLDSSSAQGQDYEDISARLLDTLMMVECYKTHCAQEEDIWDLMMERAWDAVISVLGLSDEEETLEEVAGQLRGAMMHTHYVAATGVKDSENDENNEGTTRCPACDVIWRTNRQFFCPFDHESDGVDEFTSWNEFWRHQVNKGHVVCAQEVIYQ
ncbi:related to Vault poly [Fusarium mangiferae]|uniref:Related to Vault poly n=1 Tax=Fusarium mangiferae TaxID=192010 RepID=A0A1L7SM93_FUSMA|nr:uncharacterized protein FMAN_05416 [Fusarium mangiferae]CVK87680.1 related to Vault poly [Fusarium mangiferae]